MICSSCRTSTTATPCPTCGLDPRVARTYTLERSVRTSPAGEHWDARDEAGKPVELIEMAHASDCDGVVWTDAVRRIRSLSTFRHPALPRVRGSVESGSGDARTLWLVREPVDLPAYGAQQRPPAEALVVLTEVLEALKWLHGMKLPMVLGTLRPDSLRQRADGGVLIEELVFVPRGDVPGGEDFRAPEQAEGPADVRSDLYSAAALAVFLLTGKPVSEIRDPRAGLAIGRGIRLDPGVGPLLDSMTRVRPLGRPVDAKTALEQLVRAWAGSAAFVNKGSRLREDADVIEGLEAHTPTTSQPKAAQQWDDEPPPVTGFASRLGNISTPAWVSLTFAAVMTAAMAVATPISAGVASTPPDDGATRGLYNQIEGSMRLRTCGDLWRADHPDAKQVEPFVTITVLSDGALRARSDATSSADLFNGQAQCVATALSELPGAGGEVRAGARRLARMKVSVASTGTRVVAQSWAVDRL